ncbi:hypothetical protein [Streptomyces sp. NPDC048606]|uniref:hypothetical protein n=1 Tax=Streptomyces sp. NPDC048606 TaxID=3154726 RepID=UPI0034160B94
MGTCTLVVEANGTSRIEGSGFPPFEKMTLFNPKAGAAQSVTDAGGSFSFPLTGAKPEDAVKATFVAKTSDGKDTPCPVKVNAPGNDPAKDPQGVDPNSPQYKQGFEKGKADTEATCKKGEPPKTAAPDPNWTAGYGAGADAALKSAACAGGAADEKTAQEQYSAGYQKGLQETQATCKKEPPKMAAPDPNWTNGYNAGAELALNSAACKKAAPAN